MHRCRYIRVCGSNGGTLVSVEGVLSEIENTATIILHVRLSCICVRMTNMEYRMHSVRSL